MADREWKHDTWPKILPLTGARPFSLFHRFRNLFGGFGVLGRDKQTAQHWALDLVGPDQLEAAYRGDWLARKIVDVPSYDSTRAWRTWDADQKDAQKLKDAERTLALQRKTQIGLTRARFYGGSCIIIGVDQGKFHEPLEPERIRKDDLKFLQCVEPGMLTAGPLVRDITSPCYGEPGWYMRTTRLG